MKAFRPILILLLLFSKAAWSLPYDLSPQDLKKLKEKNLIVQRKEIKGKSWPEMTIYALLDCDSLDAMGLFAYYPHQTQYVPQVIKAEAHSQSPTHVLVDYEMNMPWPIPNSIYTHGHYLKKIKGGFRLDWYLQKSNSAKEVNGSVEFIDFEGQTLMKYQNLVVPKTFFARLLKKMMVKDLRHSLKAIIKAIESSKSSNSAALQEGKKLIQKALSGELAYPKS